MRSPSDFLWRRATRYPVLWPRERATRVSVLSLHAIVLLHASALRFRAWQFPLSRPLESLTNSPAERVGSTACRTWLGRQHGTTISDCNRLSGDLTLSPRQLRIRLEPAQGVSALLHFHLQPSRRDGHERIPNPCTTTWGYQLLINELVSLFFFFLSRATTSISRVTMIRHIWASSKGDHIRFVYN
ncbi:hypothetical protein VTH06DRAFT_6381 [Thermothelomyces fergusii]